MHTCLNVILALSQLANTQEGQVVLAAVGGVVYDVTRRYWRTALPGGLFWDLHRGLKWVSQVTANLAAAMDRVAGQRRQDGQAPQ